MNLERAVSRVLWKLHRLVYARTDGRIGGQFAPKGLRSILLTTTGHRSGQTRSTPLFALEDGDRLVVVASNLGHDRDPAWWRNLQAEPRAEVRLSRERHRVQAHQATPGERDRFWSQFVAAYPGYARYEQRTDRPIPVVVLKRMPGHGEAAHAVDGGGPASERKDDSAVK